MGGRALIGRGEQTIDAMGSQLDACAMPRDGQESAMERNVWVRGRDGGVDLEDALVGARRDSERMPLLPGPRGIAMFGTDGFSNG